MTGDNNWGKRVPISNNSVKIEVPSRIQLRDGMITV